VGFALWRGGAGLGLGCCGYGEGDRDDRVFGRLNEKEMVSTQALGRKLSGNVVVTIYLCKAGSVDQLPSVPVISTISDHIFD